MTFGNVKFHLLPIEQDYQGPVVISSNLVPLRKHAYSNKSKISQTKTESFQIKLPLDITISDNFDCLSRLKLQIPFLTLEPFSDT